MGSAMIAGTAALGITLGAAIRVGSGRQSDERNGLTGAYPGQPSPRSRFAASITRRGFAHATIHRAAGIGCALGRDTRGAPLVVFGGRVRAWDGASPAAGQSDPGAHRDLSQRRTRGDASPTERGAQGLGQHAALSGFGNGAAGDRRGDHGLRQCGGTAGSSAPQLVPRHVDRSPEPHASDHLRCRDRRETPGRFHPSVRRQPP